MTLALKPVPQDCIKHPGMLARAYMSGWLGMSTLLCTSP